MFKFFNKSLKLLNYKKVLENYKGIIDSSIKPYIKITARKVKKEDDGLKLWQSKFQGEPYLPEKFEYPKNSKGKYLHLLAQINFDEMPKLKPYPTKGILQFWIGGDDLYGLSLNSGNQTKQDSFRVKYYPEIKKDNLVTDFSFLPKPDDSPFEDISQEYSLKFQKKKMPVSVNDYHFDKFFKGDIEDDVYDAYIEEYGCDEGHRIGGYAFFTQTDPRDSSYKDKNCLLLQIDTDNENEIMWGDSGVANFFINKEDLENLDFSDVLYNWDCC